MLETNNIAKRSILFFAVCISASMLSSCEYLLGKFLDCAIFGECPPIVQSSPESSPVEIPPEKAVENYYQLINQRQYAYTWAILTPGFQRRASNNDYSSYTKWWNSVEFVKISSIRLIERRERVAVVDAQLRYLMKDGREWSDPARQITLVLSSNGKWLIDDKK